MTPHRQQLLQELALNRQPDLHVVLENVRDLHNVGAVLRSCDAVGVPKVYMTLSTSFKKKKIKMGKHTSAGARKWVAVERHDSIVSCLTDIKSKGVQLLGTALTNDAISIYDVDWTQPTAIVFGNEKSGLSDLALSTIDQAVIIPQFGMVQSLNISVACAVTLYEIMRQRMLVGRYGGSQLSPAQSKLLAYYIENHNLTNGAKVDQLDQFEI